MKFNILARPALAVAFGFIGAFIARFGLPEGLIGEASTVFLVVAYLAFAVLGFVLPELVELAGKAGIAVLASQIVRHLPPVDPRRITVPTFPFYKKGKRAKYINPLVVDTSALIDGRIIDVVDTGFVFGTLIIIPSVVWELHQLADSVDSLKRARGRRGLDTLSQLQKSKSVKVDVVKSEPKNKEVDDKLVELAKNLRGKVLTVDFNLSKVAKVYKVEVLNLNELANAVKTAVLPGDELSIQINVKGKESGQGVGYLADGTMVVVEDGAGLVGRPVSVKVHKVLQTAAGKMIFARARE